VNRKGATAGETGAQTTKGSKVTESEKSSMIKEKVRALQRRHPKLSWTAAWMRTAQSDPELFREPEPEPEVAHFAGSFCTAVEKLSVVECSSPTDSLGEPPRSEIVYLPAGDSTICARVNGAPAHIAVREVGPHTAQLLDEQLARRLLSKVKPYAGFDHRAGRAAFIAKKFRWQDGRGVVLELDWTRAGKEAVVGKDYMHFSPTFLINRATGEVRGLPLHGEIGSLTNNPAFELEALAASRRCEPGEDWIMLRAEDCEGLLRA